MSYLLATVAGFVNALTSVLQRIGVESAPSSSTLRLSLMAHAIRRGIWLIGFALMLVEFALQAVALRFGQLSVVQPILTTELLFLMLILGAWFRYHLGWREWVGSATIVLGLAVFFLSGDPSGGHLLPDTHQWTVASVVLVAAIAGFVVAALHGPRWWRAASFGAATAVTAAYSAALTKATTTYITQGWGHVLTHAQPYLLAVTGIGTVFLIQNALHAGPITASRTTMVTLNPLVSIALGLLLFGDRLRGGVGWSVLQVSGLAVLVLGIVVLARSPLVAGAGGTGDPGELLATARRSRGPRSATAGPSPVVAPVSLTGDQAGVGDLPA